MSRYMPLLSVIVLSASALAEGQDQQLLTRIAELEQQVRTLEEIISGTAHPTNLGRTSLARVTASSVNGRRAMDNIYHGIVNAFDGGDNWHNGINYTSWLADYGGSPWADVYFDVPVSLTSIVVEREIGFVATLYFADGGEKKYAQASDEIAFGEVVHNVTRVRLNFRPEASGSCRVHEISVYGYAPPGIEYTVGRPVVYMALREATLTANIALSQWWEQLRASIQEPIIVEGEALFTLVYYTEAVNLLCVTINKLTGQTSVVPLAGFANLGEDVGSVRSVVWRHRPASVVRQVSFP